MFRSNVASHPLSILRQSYLFRRIAPRAQAAIAGDCRAIYLCPIPTDAVRGVCTTFHCRDM